MKDNTTPFSAKEYEKNINKTIPYYSEFATQTFDVVLQQNFSALDWLDLGCGSGYLEEMAKDYFSDVRFVLVDPSAQMLELAKQKLGNSAEYLCTNSESIRFENKFNVITAIQSHHYMQKEEREKATENVYRALKKDGIYITFENVIADDNEIKQAELLRWGRYQQKHGRTAEQAREHNGRCGVNYFPITVSQHINLLKQTGFRHVHVFWLSYMQMGVYAIK